MNALTLRVALSALLAAVCLLTPSGAHTGPAAAMLARTELLGQAGLRLPWGVAAARLLREQGLLADGAPGPRTADELSAMVHDSASR